MSSAAIPYEIDNTLEDPRTRAALVLGAAGQSYHEVSETICGVVEARHPPRAWYAAMGVSLLALGVLVLMILYLFFTGVGVWNLNRPVCWPSTSPTSSFGSASGTPAR